MGLLSALFGADKRMTCDHAFGPEHESNGGTQATCRKCGWTPNTRYYQSSTADIINAAIRGDTHARSACLESMGDVMQEIRKSKKKVPSGYASWNEFWNSPDRPRKF